MSDNETTEMVSNIEPEPVIIKSFNSGQNPKEFEATELVKRIELYECKLKKIPDELLEHVEVQDIKFRKCQFTENDTLQTLTVLPNIKRLALTRCNVLLELKILQKLELSEDRKRGKNLMNPSLPELHDDSGLQEFPEVVPKLTTLTDLGLSLNKGITSLPETLAQLTNLEKLDVSWCGFQEFPHVVSRLPKLTELNFCGNKGIKYLPESLAYLTYLQKLDVSECELEEFPQVVSRMTTLTEVNLSWSKGIKSLPESIAQLTNLQKLNLAWCCLQEFPQVISKLTSLTELDLHSNKGITSLPESLAQLQNLQKINVAWCCFEEFPEVVSKLTSLTELDLQWIQGIKSLPESLAQLTNLKTLNLSECNLMRYPDVVSNLTFLQKLDLHNNKKITELPVSMRKLSNLQVLNVRGCSIVEFPQFVFKIPSLKLVYVYPVRGEDSFPTELEKLKTIDRLDLADCDLKHFPKFITTLTTLRVLNLSKNRGITSLPDSLKQLTNLRVLDVRGCGLVDYPQVVLEIPSLQRINVYPVRGEDSFPTELEKLKAIERLDLADCDLPVFPNFITALTTLRELNLSQNRQIKSLPESLKRLTNLQVLNVRGCGLVDYPQVVFEIPTLQQVFVYPVRGEDSFPTELEPLKTIERLNLSHCDLPVFPEFITTLTTLQELDLSGNKDIKSLPASLKRLTNLQVIDVKGCRFVDYPQIVFEIPSLRQAYVYPARVPNSFPTISEKLKHVQKLNLSVCDLPMYPRFLSGLTTLEELDLSGNTDIVSLPKSITQLTNLCKLNISHCGFASFPENISELTTLQKLDLSDNKDITLIPPSLAQLTNLRVLHVEGCNLTDYPEIAVHMPSLQRIHMYTGTLGKKIPSAVNKLKSDTSLDLARCKLKTFPNVISSMTMLQKLNLSGNKNIPIFPESLVTLTNLLALELSNCGLAMCPDVVSKLKTLQELNLSGNKKIYTLQESLAQLTNLRKLNVSNCGLTTYPTVVSKLKTLQELDLSENESIALNSTVPESLAQLTNLRKLNLSNCGLTTYPEVISRLISLQELDVSENEHIRELPFSMRHLENLQCLTVRRCKIRDLNLESVDKLKSIERLDLSDCNLMNYPNVVSNLITLKELDLSLNVNITALPPSMVNLRSLVRLNISHCNVTEFPHIIYDMHSLRNVVAKGVKVSTLSETFIKMWLRNPTIKTELGFQKVEGLGMPYFVKPPNDIVKRGPRACADYYKSVTVDTTVNCTMLNVTFLGKTGAGKSSLVQTIKEGSPKLVHASDRTVVVDTLEILKDDVLLKIADFGGHEIYDITCPLFLKSTKQAAIIAVKLSEYTEENHSELVTKWLTTAASNVKGGCICIVATQCDLCRKEEIIRKMKILKNKTYDWVKEELTFQQKARIQDLNLQEKVPDNDLKHLVTNSSEMQGITDMPFLFDEDRSAELKFRRHARLYESNLHGKVLDHNYFFFETSSLEMQGIGDIQKFLFNEARSSRAVLPKHWINMYKLLYDQTNSETNFITKKQYESLFKQSMSFWKSLFRSEKDLQECLQFLHDSGMIFWFGEHNESLQKIIFHDTSFLVSVLQCLFRHDIKDRLIYDHEIYGKYISSKFEFNSQLRKFVETGILDERLLKCIWQQFTFSDEIFETMIEVLAMLDLCYKSTDKGDKFLRFPWFVERQDVDFLRTEWPKELPVGNLQYSLHYCFCHRIPGTIFERFCVRLQQYLHEGHTRKDRKDLVYIEHNRVQILLQRNPNEVEPSMTINLRCSVDFLPNLQSISVKLHDGMHNLCVKYPGLYIDSYFLCPHCLLIGSEAPTKRRLGQIEEETEIDWVQCDPHITGSATIPAAMIFLKHLETKACKNHLELIKKFCFDMIQKYYPSVSDEMLLEISGHITGDKELRSIGYGLKIEENKISSIRTDHRGDINEAGYEVLLEWRKRMVARRVSEADMKSELRTVLCNVGMNLVAGKLIPSIPVRPSPSPPGSYLDLRGPSGSPHLQAKSGAFESSRL